MRSRALVGAALEQNVSIASQRGSHVYVFVYVYMYAAGPGGCARNKGAPTGFDAARRRLLNIVGLNIKARVTTTASRKLL